MLCPLHSALAAKVNLTKLDEYGYATSGDGGGGGAGVDAAPEDPADAALANFQRACSAALEEGGP